MTLVGTASKSLFVKSALAEGKVVQLRLSKCEYDGCARLAAVEEDARAAFDAEVQVREAGRELSVEVGDVLGADLPAVDGLGCLHDLVDADGHGVVPIDVTPKLAKTSCAVTCRMLTSSLWRQCPCGSPRRMLRFMRTSRSSAPKQQNLIILSRQEFCSGMPSRCAKTRARPYRTAKPSGVLGRRGTSAVYGLGIKGVSSSRRLRTLVRSAASTQLM